MEMLRNAGLGAIAGVVYGAEGYLSQRKEKEFSMAKFLPDVVISGVAGALIGTQAHKVPGEAMIQSGITALGALGVNKIIRKGIQAILA